MGECGLSNYRSLGMRDRCEDTDEGAVDAVFFLPDGLRGIYRRPQTQKCTTKEFLFVLQKSTGSRFCVVSFELVPGPLPT